MAVAGNSKSAIYSCSRLKILGGNPDLKCPAPNNIPSVNDCVKAASPDQSALLTDAKPGAFCFDFNGVCFILPPFLRFIVKTKDLRF